MTGHQMAGIYRIEGDWTLIEIKLSETNQLFNSMDPSPFRERDLDPDAAAYIMDALRELHGHAQQPAGGDGFSGAVQCVAPAVAGSGCQRQNPE